MRISAILIGLAMLLEVCLAPPQAALALDAPQDLSITIPTVSEPPPLDGTMTSPLWQKGAKVDLGYEQRTHTPSAEKTTAVILTDGKSLYVAFDATQTRTPILTNQHTNNSGVDTDDEVKIAIWPSGKNGILYQFISTPIGTRYQYSTENTSYEPTWESVGRVAGTQYTITMRIPLSIMRGAEADKWLINFTRFEPTTGALYAWSGGSNFQGTTDQNYAMPLIGMPKAAAGRPQPRIGLYGLGSAASPTFGGNTSRTGADISIPITGSTSLIAAIHPDFSNVEQDQQSISPTAFRRFFTETRPFFTQGGNYYNIMECDACPNEQSLYSPSIPTPRDGYAIEGKQGPLTFAGFDAVGKGRSDTAQSVLYRNIPQTLFVSAQRVAVDGTAKSILGDPTSGLVFKDDTLQFATKWSDLQHKFIYANYGTESASSNWITDPSKAKFEEIGGGWFGPYSFTGGGLRKIGAQYNPIDGFFTHPSDSTGNLAMAGYGFFSQHTWVPTGGKFKQIQGSIFLDRYHSDAGGPGLVQSDSGASIDFVTRTLWEFQTNVGSSFLRVNLADPSFPTQPHDQLAPVNQEATMLTYHAGTSTPTQFMFFTGRYGYGRLDSWFRSTTMKLGTRGLLTLEADNTRQYLDNGSQNQQWLQRASIAYQFDADTSLAVGVRRFFGPPPVPYGGNTCLVSTAANTQALGYCPNISIAFHRRLRHDELYAIYGDASQTTTVPQVILKYIHYFGAEKGT